MMLLKRQFYSISNSSISECAECLAKIQSDKWGSEYDYCSLEAVNNWREACGTNASMPTEGRASYMMRGYSQGCTGSLSKSIVVGTHAGGTKTLWAECRHEAIPTDGSCWGQNVCVVCNMSGQWCPLRTSEVPASPWFSTLPLTRFSSQCIFKNLFSERFVVFLDLAESSRGKKGNNDNPITTFHPSARRIQWCKPKNFW